MSCLGNICNHDIGSVVLNQLINLLSHNKALVRKKASATIVTIFRKSPEIIPQYIDKVIGKLNGEKNICNDLLSCSNGKV